MSIVNIDGKEVHFEEDSDSAKHAVKFLQEHPNDAKAFLEAAHHDHINGVAHFETNRPGGYTGSTNFTLIHTGDGKYELRKKEHHFF